MKHRQGILGVRFSQIEGLNNTFSVSIAFA
jgi:hypothetical protein